MISKAGLASTAEAAANAQTSVSKLRVRQLREARGPMDDLSGARVNTSRKSSVKNWFSPMKDADRLIQARWPDPSLCCPNAQAVSAVPWLL